MDKKKFLFVSLDGLIADIAWQVVKEGHEVKLFIAHARRDRLGAGRVSCQADWQYVVGPFDLRFNRTGATS